MVFFKKVSCHVHQLVHGCAVLADQYDVVGEEQAGDVDGVERDTQVGHVELQPKGVDEDGKQQRAQVTPYKLDIEAGNGFKFYFSNLALRLV